MRVYSRLTNGTRGLAYQFSNLYNTGVMTSLTWYSHINFYCVGSCSWNYWNQRSAYAPSISYTQNGSNYYYHFPFELNSTNYKSTYYDVMLGGGYRYCGDGSKVEIAVIEDGLFSINGHTPGPAYRTYECN